MHIIKTIIMIIKLFLFNKDNKYEKYQKLINIYKDKNLFLLNNKCVINDKYLIY